MTMKRFCMRTITLVAILALAQFALVEPASAGRRGGVRYGGGHGSGGPGHGGGAGVDGPGGVGRVG
jgi:hypothetical protein